MEGKKKERIYSKREQLAIFFLIGLFLPLTILLFMVPGSWYSAEGYEDLGVLDFVASQAVTRNKKDYIVYQAADGSGLSFRQREFSLHSAREAVEQGQRVQRQVYRARQRPNFVLGLVRNAGIVFLQEGQDFQRGLRTFHTLSIATRAVGLCYIGVYTAVVLRRRKVRAAKAVQN